MRIGRRSLPAFVTVFMLILATPASASSSVTHDARGDSLTPQQPYTDIVMAKVTVREGRDLFVFQQVLADKIPSTPTGPAPYNGFTAYNWLVDTNGDGIANPVVVVRFCSKTVQAACGGTGAWHWEAALTDTRTGRAVATLDFTITGNVVTAFVPGECLPVLEASAPCTGSSPSSFRWIAATRNSPASSGEFSRDTAPDLHFNPDGSFTPVWSTFSR